ncbi:glycoside hydrolase family 20 protein [Rhodotorula graminis WP1]|uniref:beta-N-acetylhexosaminidase n=1 Tax=Rhodotorula graminis (strain WP1) TaxID=578459 RepID=A0A194SC71_RHOGW|nr:glycoside hydrolase family 20 protein [Rhodotorula graminis WP1]KPV78194.1 glycoside hydrolase family 20 protein [Rhodotorula graminis WP1]
MASVKLNVFHWHVVDSQSWPLNISTFPDLADLGAYSHDEIYREEDVKRVVDFAASLGIAVLLEADMPGHTASVAAAFPDYVACLDARPWSTYAAEPPAGQLKLGDPDVLAFSRRVLQDATSSSSSRLFSTGGDEVNERCYLDDPATSAILAAQNVTIDQLLSRFVNGIHDTVREGGKEPVVWEEMVLKHDLDLGSDVVVMVWINSSNVRAVADKGHRLIHAASDFFYLDCAAGGAGSWLGKTPNATSWCDPYKSWQKAYSFDPYLDLDLAQRHLVLGGEALVWSEQAGPANLDSISWPRAAAAAEVFWMGGAVAPGQRDLGDALPRLHDWRYRAVRRGVQATPLQPHWCALRPGSCDLE